ncbi:hypothetical protein EDB85DRAFT_2165047 [Lactarius pseudohatsudake]|nr:hypothetical protein EDB85DRAFT_2165047 [Lactarius pseudohatsudake]
MPSASYDFTSNINPSLIGNNGDSAYNPRSHRQYDSSSERPCSHIGPNYSPDPEEVISNTSAKMLENNGHFIRVQMTSEKRATEITRLEEALADKTKENNELKEENKDLKVEVKALRGAIELFAKEYHESTSGIHINGVLASLRTGTVPAKPALRKHMDVPMVVQWTRKDFRRVSATKGNTNRGETDGNATSMRQKGKCGRPRKDSNDDGHATHHYLENEDGTPVSADIVAEMSHKARMLWATLDEDGMAPATFGGISMKAWEYFSRMMLADEAHDFLLLCDVGEWKLWEWSTRSYPSWHRNRFAVPKDATKTPEKGSTQEPGTGSDDADTGGQSPAGDDNDNDTEGQRPTGDNNDNDGGPEEQSPAGNSDDDNDVGEQSPADDNNNNEDEPGDSVTQGTTPSSNASPTETRTTPSSVVIDPLYFPFLSTSPPLTRLFYFLQLSEINTYEHQRGPSLTNSTASSEANPLNDATGAEGTPTPGRNPMSDSARTATDDNPGSDDHNTLPSPSEATANNASAKTKGKKRSADGNPSTSSKRQKRADAMAEPTDTNSIKNICMRQWNGTQPGGQGLLSEFESYFKTLSEPFKKELRAAQAAARKVKTAAKKATGVTNGN